MIEKPRYLQGYAVVRIDDGPLDDLGRVRELIIDGAWVPRLGGCRSAVVFPVGRRLRS